MSVFKMMKANKEKKENKKFDKTKGGWNNDDLRRPILKVSDPACKYDIQMVKMLCC